MAVKAEGMVIPGKEETPVLKGLITPENLTALPTKPSCLCTLGWLIYQYRYLKGTYTADKVMIHRSYQPEPASWWPRFSWGPKEPSRPWPWTARPVAWLLLLWRPPLQNPSVKFSLHLYHWPCSLLLLRDDCHHLHHLHPLWVCSPNDLLAR